MARRLQLRRRKYWIVGANWDGKDKSHEFIQKQYWKMDYLDDEKPNFAKLREQMEEGDRIAIKARCGYGSDQITIKALGVVIGREKDENGRVFVDWKVTGLSRKVECKNCFATIHGPYSPKEEWIKKVFLL